MSGWRYRKAINFGPLRFTLSGSGVSVSLGAGPFRVTRRANGTVFSTTHIPGTGVYRRDKL